MRNLRSSRLPLPVVLACLLAGAGLPGSTREAEKFSLYRSTDHGASWSRVGRGLPPEARINALAVEGKVAYAGTDRGLFLSGDAGASWQPAPVGTGQVIRVLSFATRAGQVFAGTGGHGVIVSHDQGESWIGVNRGLTDLTVRSLLSVGTRLYAGTENQGVFVSDDAGASWKALRGGLPDPVQVFDLAWLEDGTVFAGLYSQGLYRWEAKAGIWTKAGDVAPLQLAVAGGSLVAGLNPGGILFSADGGKTWQEGNAGLPPRVPVWILAAQGRRVWAGASGQVGLPPEEVGLFASQDGGKSWARSDAGLPAGGAAVSFAVTEELILAGISVADTGRRDAEGAPARQRFADSTLEKGQETPRSPSATP